MNNSKKLCTFIGSLLVMMSCTDLNLDIESQYVSYPDSEIALEAKMADVYYSFRKQLGGNYMICSSLSSDEYSGVHLGSDYWDKGEYFNPSVHKLTPNDLSVSYYADLASGITKCNQIIEELGGEENPNCAPAIAMRAFYNFILMDSYGAIPILDSLPDGDERIEREPRSKVIKFIESDLLKAIDNLPTAVDASTYGKPTRWMAAALLVKLYINWGVYSCDDVTTYTETTQNPKLDECIKWCDEIIGSGLFDLSNSYREKFLPTNGVHIKDFIYAMPYDCYNNTGMFYSRYRTWRKGNNDGEGGPSYYGYVLNNSVAGIFALNPEMVDLFCLKGDDRNEVIIRNTIFMYDPVTYQKTKQPYLYKGNPVVLTKDIKIIDNTLDVGNDVNGWSQGYRSIKWWPSAEAYNAGRNQENDVPIFRYADVLLTKAEAILRGGKATNGDTPVSLMNQIRSYVHAPLVSEKVTLQDILDERGREFLDENWRRNDLIRFNKFEEDWGHKNILNPKAKTNKNLRIIPIPTDIMNKNVNWEQNPGY